MSTATLAIVASVGGVSIQKTVSKTGDHPNVYEEIALPAATALATYVNDADDTASGTLTADHGLATGTYDLYWADGVHYGATVTITTNDFSLASDGAGDAIPASSTVCNISEQVDINTAIDGDEIEIIVMNATKRSNINFLDTGDASIEAIELLSDEPYIWHNTNGITNPFTGNPITSAVASNGETAAGTITIASLEDSTP